MAKLSFKTALLAGFILVVTSMISGYFFSIGADLWELTKKDQLNLINLINPFWVVSVPIGILGLILAIWGLLEYRKTQRKLNSDILMRLLESVKDQGEMWILGTDYRRWSVELYEAVKDCVKRRNISFTLLIADPKSKNLKNAINAELIDIGSDNTIESSLKVFHKLRDELKVVDRRKIQIRLFDLPLAFSLIVVNPNEPIAEAHVFPYLYKVGYMERPWLIYRKNKKEQRPMFDRCKASYEYVLGKSWEGKG